MTEASVTSPKLAPRLLPVALLTFAYLAAVQFYQPYLSSNEAYFHIKLAYLMRLQGLVRLFPWAAWSTWSDGFVDQSLLYHLFLLPFAGGDTMAGAKWAAITIGVAVVCSLFAVLHLNRIKHAGMWLALLFGTGYWLITRITAAQPQLFSVLFALWTVHLLLNRRPRLLFVLSAAYALSFTTAVPIGLALIYLAAAFLFSRRIEWRGPAAVVCGFAFGLWLNPYFPGQITAYLQSSFFAPLLSDVSLRDLDAAEELLPLDTLELMGGALPLVLVCCIAIIAAVRAPRPHGEKTLILLAMAQVFVLLTFWRMCFVDYALPLSLLAVAFFADPYLRAFDPAALLGARPVRALVGFAAAIALAVFLIRWVYYAAIISHRGTEPKLVRSAAALGKSARSSDLVFSCSWEDTSQLFYFNDQLRYLGFLDPATVYYHNKAAWVGWQEIAEGLAGEKTGEQLKALGIKYGVCTRRYEELRKIAVEGKGVRLLHSDEDAYVFEVTE